MIFGVILAFILNHYFIYEIAVPDPCYYHVHETNFLIDLFYSTDSASNGHPEPNLFNLVLTVITGAFLGKIVFNIINRENQTS